MTHEHARPASSELHAGPGFRIRLEIERPDPDVVSGLSEFATPPVSDLMNRLYTMNHQIQNLTAPDRRLAGPAVTVKVFPGDNLMVHKSLDVAAPGDVVVIDAGASTMNAVIGDLIATKARHRGIVGFVVDGLVRDLEALRQLSDIPIFARGISAIGPLHRGPGEINHPICAGGVVVQPGDVVIGDANGVVVVPAEIARDLLDRLRTRAAAEAEYESAVARGEFSNRWVDDILDAGAVELD